MHLGTILLTEFGTRRSKVQILSPRPFIPITYTCFWFFRYSAVDDFVVGKVPEIFGVSLFLISLKELVILDDASDLETRCLAHDAAYDAPVRGNLAQLIHRSSMPPSRFCAKPVPGSGENASGPLLGKSETAGKEGRMPRNSRVANTATAGSKWRGRSLLH